MTGATWKTTSQQVPASLWYHGDGILLLFFTCHFLRDHLAELQSLYSDETDWNSPRLSNKNRKQLCPRYYNQEGTYKVIRLW